MQRFPLAPMSRLIYWMSVFVLLLPVLLYYAGSRASGVIGTGTAALLLGIYLFIWVYMRPSHFELSPQSLDVVWPIRRFSTPISEIESIERLDGEQFRARYGYGMRIGAGGLWGGFGLLKMKNEMFRFYISRLDGYVLVRSRSARPLLITPAEPDGFVAVLESLRRG